MNKRKVIRTCAGLNSLLQRKSGDATDKSSKRCKETALAGCGHGAPREPVPGTEQAEQVNSHPPRIPRLQRCEVQPWSNGQGRCTGEEAPGLCSTPPPSPVTRPAEDAGTQHLPDRACSQRCSQLRGTAAYKTCKVGRGTARTAGT